VVEGREVHKKNVTKENRKKNKNENKSKSEKEKEKEKEEKEKDHKENVAEGREFMRKR
jgi:hypothetical protein